MEEITWSKEDIAQIARAGITVEEVESQIALLRRGGKPVRLHRPCATGNGIVVIPPEERDYFASLYDEALGSGAVAVKFVPASGAATRMFKGWYRNLEEGGIQSDEERRSFVAELHGFAFFDDLREAAARNGYDLHVLLAEEKIVDILNLILTPTGLDYGWLPKALLKFHAYPEGNRTAIEEHLAEAALYGRDARGVCRIHFTVSEEHRAAVEDRLSRIREGFEERYGVRFDLSLSVQEPSSDTIAVDRDGRPFRDQTGRLVFRPGGHGALLTNLNRLEGDIIFVKNIDNVVPDRLKPSTVLFKKILGGCLIDLQRETFRHLRGLEAGTTDEVLAGEIAHFCTTKLSAVLPADFASYSLTGRREYLAERLNRPIRVCGMVRNEGEPGGGPFWVEEKDGTRSLQIVEEFQVDRSVAGQRAAWEAATHFNPVDLVCAIRDYAGRKFDLTRFVNRETFCITEKSEKGRELKALELPGLWNGSMAFWNTVFVEVPIETFNPVKTAADLLRPSHRA